MTIIQNHSLIHTTLAKAFATFSMPKKEVACGRITQINATLLNAVLPHATFGELCVIESTQTQAEVIAINGQTATLSPFSEPVGLAVGQLVRPLGHTHQVLLGPHLLGSIVDGFGNILHGNQPSQMREYRPLENAAPDPLTRKNIDTPLPLGVRAIDSLLTCGIGQRMGIFAAAGGGKSTLLSMICDGTQADIIVLALIGERGREVREFLEHALSAQARARTVVVVATSDRPAIERLKAAYSATVIAEYFRDQGKNVLLMMDSLTRFARAAREIGMATGEPLNTAGFPPSLYARLPRLLERTGNSDKGSITGLYTVLVEGDNLNEPLADEVRSILDGHIVLSRKLAQAHHYPAIDVNASISRIMQQIVPSNHVALAGRLRQLLAAYKEVELLIRVGEYESGQDPLTDEAIARRQRINQFLCQATNEKISFTDSIAQLTRILN